MAAPDRARMREELLRPSRYIGYDHDSLAMHLVSIESYDLARAELERAIWLNPYEPRFVFHLAWCLYRGGRLADASARIESLRAGSPDNERYEELARLIERAIAKGMPAS